MKVAIDCREMEGRPTGVGRYLAQILKRWNSGVFHGNEIHLYFKSGIPAEPFLVGLPFKKKILRFPLFTQNIFWEQVLLPFHLKKDAIDVFWGPNGVCSPLAFGVKKVVNMHDLAFFKEDSWFPIRERILRRWKASLAIRSADVLIAISEATRGDLNELFPSASGKTHVVYGGSDHSVPKNAPSARPDAGPVLFVGSLFERRAIEELICAMALLKKKHRALSLTILGENRTFPRKDYGRLIRELGLSHDIFLKGYAEEGELESAYEKGGIFCFPSLYEGFGIPIVEAQRYGLPVVTLENSSLAEIGQDSVLYSPSEKAEDLAKTIEKLLSDNAHCLKLREKGFQNSLRFEWKHTSAQVLSLLGLSIA